MSNVPTARLLNEQGRVTSHTCIRLEIRRVQRDFGARAGRWPGIYPIYQCDETRSERIYGCLCLDTSPAELDRLFPGIVLELGDELEEDFADDQAADRFGETSEKAA